MNQCCCHGRVNAAREGTDDLAIADLIADAFDAFAYEAGRSPVATTSAHSIGEVLDDLFALRCVGYFRMELKAVHARAIADNRVARIFRIGERTETSSP